MSSAAYHSSGAAGANRSPPPAPPGGSAEPRPPSLHHDSLIAEAEALKALLRDGYERANRLLAALKRQRQQSKLLSSTVNALRQLRQIDP